MNIYEKIGKNIKYYLSQLNNDVKFRKLYSNISSIEYLSVQSNISIKRLKNIISGTAKTRICELYKIAIVLNVKIDNLLNKDNKNI